VERDLWLTEMQAYQMDDLALLSSVDRNRCLLQTVESQAVFWQERGVRQVQNVFLNFESDPNTLLTASKILFACSSVLSVKQMVLSEEFMFSIVKWLGEPSVKNQLAACYGLMSVLVEEEGEAPKTYTDLLCRLVLERRITKLLINVLLLEEENMLEFFQEILLTCLCNLTYQAPIRSSLAGQESLLRYLRVMLSLDFDSKLLLPSVRLLGNLALVENVRDALSLEFDVSDLLLNMLRNAKDPELRRALSIAFVNVCHHDLISTQVLRRLDWLLELVEDKLLFSALILIFLNCSEEDVDAAVLTACFQKMTMAEAIFESYVELILVILKRFPSLIEPLLQEHVAPVVQKYRASSEKSKAMQRNLKHLDMFLPVV
jgi:hypothetical protein